jgi:hypothetical protein
MKTIKIFIKEGLAAMIDLKNEYDQVYHYEGLSTQKHQTDLNNGISITILLFLSRFDVIKVFISHKNRRFKNMAKGLGSYADPHKTSF